jgi:hypothetical protein
MPQEEPVPSTRLRLTVGRVASRQSRLEFMGQRSSSVRSKNPCLRLLNQFPWTSILIE